MSKSSVQNDLPLILVVDDDKSSRLLMCEEMEKEGYLVAQAKNGEECLTIYKQLQPDIVLLDALMPVMDGFICCDRLQQLAQNKRSNSGDSFQDCYAPTPILMITSLEDQESVDRAFSAGATDFVTKPIHWAVLKQRVRRLVQASRAERNVNEQKQIATETRNALAKEKELNELKSRFVTMTSHEFRTPLTTILSSAELLQDYGEKWTEEKKLQHLERIIFAVKHMTGLLEDVLLVDRAEAGKLECKPAWLNLAFFCRTVVEEMQTSDRDRKIAFRSHNPYLRVFIDEKLLRLILSNLLSNAIKYSHLGGAIDFHVIDKPKTIIFQIQDRGIGIPPADRDQIYESFYRGSNIGTISGNGLGLAIVKRSVDLLGGNIMLNSQLGGGTTFTVTIPLNQGLG